MIVIEFLQTSCSYHRQEQDLRELGILLSQLHGEPREVTATFPMAAHIAIARDEANIGDAPIVGMATLVPVYKLNFCKGLIEDVVVLENYRGRSISKQLMQALIERARELKLKNLELTSRSAREAANRLYQSLGFQLRETNAYRLDL